MMSISHAHNSNTTSAVQIFYPLHTVRCVGSAVFRIQAARDVACLFDVDDDVISWACLPVSLSRTRQVHQPDFLVIRQDGKLLLDVQTHLSLPLWVPEEAAAAGFKYISIERSQLPNIRLNNAADLLRYARFQVSLEDRIRLLAALDEQGSMSVAECLPVFRSSQPIASLAALHLHRFISMELDDALLGPESQVRRHRD